MQTESDTRANYIDPKLQKANWNAQNVKREYSFTDGRIGFGGTRGERKRADYILHYKGVNLAIIEAKKENLLATEGLEQVKEYGKILNIRFVYSSNGKEIYEFDLENGKGDFVENFPTPDKLYAKIFDEKNDLKEKLLAEGLDFSSGKRPRYYQEIAINKVMEALGDNKNRILLTLATGTGKTFIAYQIVYKLFQAKWSLEGLGIRRPRILFLADRNILVDQAMNTFNSLEKDILKINGEEFKKRNGKVPTNANVFFAIYQALIGGLSEDDINEGFANDNKQTISDDKNGLCHSELVSESLKNMVKAPEINSAGQSKNILKDSVSSTEGQSEYYKKYFPDFFDLIIIDECHRGGAKNDGKWREILNYFQNAVHLGLTATPKRDDNVDTYNYFGEPVYEYSLKNGIDDGFLTPFKIKRIKLNIDELILNSGDEIVQGEAEKDIYYTKDMEKNIVIHERSDLIANTILNQINYGMGKTIVFCVDQAHALRIRDAINKYKTNKDPDYCVRITSDEGEIGRRFLERFQDNDRTIPVILTTSQMLTTGVDALNVRNIVLVRNIGSIVEYKQIIGRGTRVFEGKDHFTIYDFVGATNDFRDEIWDGNEGFSDDEEQMIADDKKGKNILKDSETSSEGHNTEEKKEKLVVKLGPKREVKIIDIETRYLDLITGKHLNSEDFLKNIVGKLPELYENEGKLRWLWSNPETREDLLKKLASLGLGIEQLEDLRKMFSAESCDIFDVLAHISFNVDMKYRTERSIFGEVIIERYEDLTAKNFLEFLLNLYVKEGILSFKKDAISSKIKLFGRGETREIANKFGGVEKLKKAYYELQESLYVR